MKREDVYKLIDGERDYQEQRWTSVASQGTHDTPEAWLLYMEDYLDEAKHIVSREAGETAYPKAMEIIRKITGMGVAAMEAIETAPRK